VRADNLEPPASGHVRGHSYLPGGAIDSYVAPMTNHRGKFEGGRGFLIVFGALATLYSGLGVSYLSDPDGAIRSLSQMNQRLGGVALAVPDVPPWRYATAAAMVTLGLMCLMLVIDLRRNHPVLVPAVFFKAANATLWFTYYAQVRLPVFLAAGLLDGVLVVVMVGVATRAHRRLIHEDAVAGASEPVGELVTVP
jgi:hypothetical protein